MSSQSIASAPATVIVARTSHVRRWIAKMRAVSPLSLWVNATSSW